MKQIYTLLILVSAFICNAQIVNIPDVNFKTKLLEADGSNFIALNSSNQSVQIDINNDNEIQVSEALLIYYLDVSNANISSLTGINAFTNLLTLDCQNNQLTNLNISNNLNLYQLQCYNNQLQTLDVSNNLYLYELDCNNNLLSSLDFSHNNGLSNWSVHDNENLIFLNVKNGALYDETCDGCTNFFNCPNLEYICADENYIDNIEYFIDEYGYTNCNVNSYCSFTPSGNFYTINGTTKLDLNNNGCDNNDIIYPNVNFSITGTTTNSTFIADDSGLFSIPLGSGTYTITPILENPSYYNITPSSLNITFPSQSSPFAQNFCISPNVLTYDLEVICIPYGPARPGFNASYKIIYKNKGNQTQSGTINFTFEDDKIDFVSSNPAFSSASSNNLNWTFTNILPLETREINLIFNINSPMEIPAVNIGDQLNFTATINPIVGDAEPTDNTSSLKQTVIGAYDPNDKNCIEGTTVAPSIAGQYVHYVIRFENTGNANAENVVVKDIIDISKFDINSIITLRGSHDFITRIVNNNQVEFIFENINLPFDDANNDGYVLFKIKTKPTLVVGNTFSNTASIYFDYNFPIITNTYTTLIQTLGNSDFDFSSAFSLSPVPTKNALTINPKIPVLISSVNIYNTQGQLIQVNTNPGETLDVSILKSGSYFIQILSDKGITNGKFIKE